MINSGLIELVKQQLNITWSDPKTDSKVVSITEDAIITINGLIGVNEGVVDYLAPSIDRRLLLNLCLYMWNDVDADFQTNYAEDILQARQMHEVDDEN